MARNIVFYGIIGFAAAFIEFSIFKFLLQADNNLFISNTIALVASISFSFICNATFNFKKKDRYGRRALKFYIVCSVGLILSNLLIYFFSLTFSAASSKLISMPIVIGLQFTLNFLWTFRDYKSKQLL